MCYVRTEVEDFSWMGGLRVELPGVLRAEGLDQGPELFSYYI